MYQEDGSWWDDTTGEVHSSVVSAFKRIEDEQRENPERDLHRLRLYSNFVASSLTGRGYNRASEGGKMKANVIKIVVDTVTSRIGTVRPRPLFLTEKGNWNLQTKAKNLSKFVMGLFNHLGQWDIGLQVFRDACIFGIGVEHVTSVNGRICVERVLPHEVVVDDVEAKYGDPRCLYRHKEISPSRLARLYPKHKEAIMASSLIRDESNVFVNNQTYKPISWVEAWKLPSFPGAGDGRHVIATDRVTLLDEPWERDDFPFVFFRWVDAPIGFRGMSLTDDLAEIQREINFILHKIQRSMNMANVQIWAQENTINKNTVTNDDFPVNFYRGATPPVIMPVTPIHPDFYRYVSDLWARAFEIAGISQLSAAGRKPAGLNSGAALREHQDIESLRFLDVQQRWESFYISLAKKLVHEASYLDETLEGGFSIHSSSDKALESLDFSSIKLDDNKYDLSVYPTSLLPRSPAGKLQTIQDMGQISPEIQQEMISLLDFPDLDAALARINSPGEMADMLINDIIENSRYRPPEPLWPLQMMLNRFTQAAIKADIDGVPEDRIQMLRDFISEADAMLNPPQPPPEMAGAMPMEAGAMPAMASEMGALPPVAPGATPEAAIAGLPVA